MIVGGQTEARAQLSSTIIDYHEPFDQGFRLFFLFLYLDVFSCKNCKLAFGLSVSQCKIKLFIRRAGIFLEVTIILASTLCMEKLDIM